MTEVYIVAESHGYDGWSIAGIFLTQPEADSFMDNVWCQPEYWGAETFLIYRYEIPYSLPLGRNPEPIRIECCPEYDPAFIERKRAYSEKQQKAENATK